MTRILCSSDWHADWKTSGVDRYDDVADAVAQTVRVAREERVHLYLMTGDLCDPDDGPRALRAVALMLETTRELRDAGIPVALISGNHDCIEDGSGRTTLSPLRVLGPDVYVFERPGSMLIPVRDGMARLLALPYPPASAPYDPAEFMRRERSKRETIPIAVVAGHMTEVSWVGDDGEENREMGRGRGVPFPFEVCSPDWLLLNGHWHLGRTVQCGEHTLHIPGSLVRLNHGEEKIVPRFLLLDV